MSELKLYQCHKIVHGRPMSFHEWCRYKGIERDTDVVDAPGFLVVYSKGTPTEYESWSPYKAFVDGYSEMPQPTEINLSAPPVRDRSQRTSPDTTSFDMSATNVYSICESAPVVSSAGSDSYSSCSSIDCG
jgi:hypothetical protein